MKYPQYLFLTYGSYESQWWASQMDEPINCSPEDRAEVLQFSFAALHFPSFFSANASAIIDEDHGADHDNGLVSWSNLYHLPINLFAWQKWLLIGKWTFVKWTQEAFTRGVKCLFRVWILPSVPWCHFGFSPCFESDYQRLLLRSTLLLYYYYC